MVSNEDRMLLVPPEFPEDVVLEIVLRLPVKSILRFKCVSKSWYSFLNSRNFIAKHLSIQSEEHLFITTRCEQTKHSTAYSISNIDDVNTYTELDMLSPYINHYNVVDDQHVWQIHGPCNGLIVIADYIGGDAILCNIATRSFRTLPNSYFYPFPKNDYEELVLDHFGQQCHAYIGYIGLGYDSKHEDYKVLRVFEFWEDVYRNVELPPRAEVFSIGTDTCWREIDMTNIPNFSNFYRKGTYIDDSFCWITYDDRTLWSFDVVDERFRNVPLPKRIDAHEEDDVLAPAVYNNKLALFVLHNYYSLERDTSIDVWVMKEFRIEQSWTKLLTIRPLFPLDGRRALTFCKNDTEFFYNDSNGQLRVYDLVTKETKTISFKDDDKCSAVVPYTQTLACISSR